MAEGMTTLVLATHTWHMVETRDGGVMGPGWVRENAERVRDVISGILDLGFEPSVIG